MTNNLNTLALEIDAARAAMISDPNAETRAAFHAARGAYRAAMDAYMAATPIGG